MGVGATTGTVGRKHNATIANVAARFIMQQPAVAAVIVGARLGESSHISENQRIFNFHLDTEDISQISAAVSALNPVPGDCGDEYRKPPFLTATGDLSDHLETLPQVVPPLRLSLTYTLIFETALAEAAHAI